MNKKNILQISKSKVDGSLKILWKNARQQVFESAAIPFRNKGIYTVCLSSQSGCNLDCKICMTSTFKYAGKLNISASDIIEQAVLTKQIAEEAFSELKFDEFAFMGMGEPFLNLDNLIAAIESEKLKDEVFAISSVGIIPGIKKLMQSALSDLPRLQLSVHKISDRKQLIPADKVYPVHEVMRYALEYAGISKKPLTLNWVLLEKINDSLSEARRLCEIIDPRVCRINVTNYVGKNYKSPKKEVKEAFIDALKTECVRIYGCEIEVNAFEVVGTDIAAGCGQMIGKYGVQP